MNQGSTYIYTTYLQPFFTRNEADLDEGIVQVQKNVLVFIQSRLTALWEFILNAANKRQTATSTDSGTPNTNAANGTARGSVGLQNVLGLWQTYGTSIMNALGSKGSPATTASASSSSVEGTPGAAPQRRSAQGNNSSNSPTPVHTPAEAPNPPFPEPHHFS